jgi:hypothetical protein
MTGAQESEAGRSLANVRWRGQVIAKAIETLRSRSTELDSQQLADLRAIAGPEESDE